MAANRAGTVLSATWTEPVDFDAWRVLDDPLGLRATSNALAASMFSPITSRTTSVRQLGLLLVAAEWALDSKTEKIDMQAMCVNLRLMTLALCHPEVTDDGRSKESPIAGMPGRNMSSVLRQLLLIRSV